MGANRLSPIRRRVVAEIVRLLIPPHPVLDRDSEDRVRRDVAAFVESQIAGLPSFLPVPYQALSQRW